MVHTTATKKTALKTDSWYIYQTQVCGLHEGTLNPPVICLAVVSDQISVWLINGSRKHRPSPPRGVALHMPVRQRNPLTSAWDEGGEDQPSRFGAVAAFRHVSLSSSVDVSLLMTPPPLPQTSPFPVPQAPMSHRITSVALLFCLQKLHSVCLAQPNCLSSAPSLLLIFLLCTVLIVIISLAILFLREVLHLSSLQPSWVAVLLFG